MTIAAVEQTGNEIDRGEVTRVTAGSGLSSRYSSNRRCFASQLYSLYKNSNEDLFPNEPCGQNVIHLTVRRSKIHYIPNNFFMHTHAFANLLTLRLDDIAIKEIEPNNFENITRLEHLFLSLNEIQTIPSSIFMHLPILRVADLSFNKISSIEKGAFAECIALQKLQLNGNKLKTIETEWFERMRNLNYLDLSDNLIENELDGNAFVNNQNFQYLYVRNNRIERIVNFNYETRNLMETIDVSHNPLLPIYPLVFASRTFNYHHSNVTDCFIDHRVVILDASHCKIKTMSISTSAAIIEEIYLSYNLIENVANFTNLLSLNELDLSSNRIKVWQHHTNLPNLKILNLSNNQLMYLDLGVDKWITPELHDLCLYSNQLQTLELNDFAVILPHLKTIYLENNKWRCPVIENILNKLHTANVTIRLLNMDRAVLQNSNNDFKGIRCISD